MGMKHLVAAAIVAVGSTTAFAAPAFADPDTTGSKVDQSFTKAISNSGLSIAPKDAIALAHSTCDLVELGGTVNDALRHLKDATGWTSMDDFRTFGSLAARAYCPNAIPQ